MVDRQGRVAYWNQALEEMTGMRRSEVLGQGYEVYAPVFYGTARPLLADVVLGRGREYASGYARFYQVGRVATAEGLAPSLGGGRGGWLWETAVTFRRGGRVAGAVECLADVSRRREEEERFHYLAYHDFLTGLYNRAFFEEEVQRLAQGREFPVSVLVADVDGLKEVNDTWGHAMGDTLLLRMARVLKSQLRAEDVVARIGGDEFAVLLPRTQAATVAGKMWQLREALGAHNVDHPDLPLRLSLGVATAEEGQDLREAWRRADLAMCRAKAGSTFCRGQDPRATYPLPPNGPAQQRDTSP